MILWVCFTLCQQIWKTQQWPQDWKRSVLIPIPKKGNAKESPNYRTIALISYASKVMLKILQARLQQYVNHELPDIQAEFWKGRGTRNRGSEKKLWLHTGKLLSQEFIQNTETHTPPFTHPYFNSSFIHSLIDSFIHLHCSVKTVLSGHQTKSREEVRLLWEEDDDSDPGQEMERSGLISDNILRLDYVRNQDRIILRSIPQISLSLLFIRIELWLFQWVLLLKPPFSSRCSTNDTGKTFGRKKKKKPYRKRCFTWSLCFPAPSSETSVYHSWLQSLLQSSNFLPST